MKKVIVRYTVKADKAEENRQLIEKVFAELKAVNPGGLRYASYVLADGVSFVHVASVESSDGNNPLNTIQAFQEFTKDIKDRCEQPPVSSEAREIGSYGF